MKLIIQRVSKATVIKQQTSEVVGKIDSGLFVLVGIKKGDTFSQVEALAEKLIKLRVMSDQNDKMNLSVLDANASFLIVSQFTLYADTSGGNRPSFVNAEEPGKAKILYEALITKLRELKAKVETGSFGDYMKIETVLDGPVTIVVEN